VNCEDVRSKLTAYLDGELEDNRGSAVRGHLRGCDACRAMAADEAALRDGLRALPPLDPPNALWSGIQARLAAEEVADSERPAWRRALARLGERWRPMAPQLALGTMALAIAVLVLAVRYRDSQQPTTPVASNGPALPVPAAPQVAVPAVPAMPPMPPMPGDVVAELASDRTDRTSTYQHVADALVEDAMTARANWPDDHKQAFDAKLAGFKTELAAAPEGRGRDKVYRAMIRYLQNAAIRDEVAATSLADTRGAP
jgi:anti-sigma factor RsiW